MEAINTKDWNDAKNLPETKREDWEDNDGKGGLESFWSDKSELCLIECDEGIHTGHYDAKYGDFFNSPIGTLGNVTKWKYLK